jgi:hypothetical protein
MANIKLKPIDQLDSWNAKELRKLRMTIKNRLSAFENSNDPKELPDTHPLHGMEPGELKELLLNVQRAEKAL